MNLFLSNENIEKLERYTEESSSLTIDEKIFDKKQFILEQTSDINIFIGGNNSGKSMFLREIMKNDIIYYGNLEKLNIINEKYPDILNSKIIYIFTCEYLKKRKDYNDKFKKFESIEKDFKLSLNFNSIRKTEQYISLIITILETLNSYKKRTTSNQEERNKLSNALEKEEKGRQKAYDFIGNLKSYKEILKLLEEFDLKTFSKKIYIPTLRTSHLLYSDDKSSEPLKDIFKATVYRNYKDLPKEGENSNFEIFTGLNLYGEIVNMRNSKKEERNKFDEFETFISTHFFKKRSVDIVSIINTQNSQAKDIQVSIGDETNLAIHELGDGIQALILLLFKVYMADDNSVIFIDEPELNLHPGMQRIFLEQIIKQTKDKNLKVFIVTHSNHLLDLTIEQNNISIFKFKKSNSKKFQIQNVLKGDKSILSELGVNSTSSFIANCSVWVEGISDRYYIEGLLEAYQNNDEENTILNRDIDYTYFEFSGINITHYNLDEDDKKDDLINVLSSTNKLILIEDNDNAKENSPKYKRHKKFKNLAENNKNITYHNLKCREIENIFNEDIWIKIILHPTSEVINKKFRKSEEFSESDIKSELENLNFSKNKSTKDLKLIEYLKEELEEINSNKNIFDENIFNKIDNGSKSKLSNAFKDLVSEGKIEWKDIEKCEYAKELTETVYNTIKES